MADKVNRRKKEEGRRKKEERRRKREERRRKKEERRFFPSLTTLQALPLLTLSLSPLSPSFPFTNYQLPKSCLDL
ncbi:MAG: hypothetical protein HC849_31240 [Oscillatoriales cyanobacterium RU_3_3]|nr:hypothetical protein [Oscillatoriales cyanobacterium RU_3_3]NJR21801.1 hypothetical protein [Richelia sp. CSU_2_1]